MTPRKRRGVGRPVIAPPPLASTPTIIHPVNTCGFAVLPDEIQLEIVSYIVSVPIPTPFHSDSYPEIRRSRHETLLSLSQTSRSLRRFFCRYLWQRIEVREGMKIGDEDDTLTSKDTPILSAGYKKNAIELVRQLEIVTVRNPQLAQYVNYMDILIGEYSMETVLAELARCLTLLSNLHTVQIDVMSSSRGRTIFERTFKKYSYPQIRNAFVMPSSQSFLASCPQARCVGLTRNSFMSASYLQTIMENCPHLEVLEMSEKRLRFDITRRAIVDSFPNLRTIRVMMSYSWREDSPPIDILKELNHLHTIVIVIDRKERNLIMKRTEKEWIKWAQQILTQIQLRDNLEKTIVIQTFVDLRRILIKPGISIDFEEFFEI